MDIASTVTEFNEALGPVGWDAFIAYMNLVMEELYYPISLGSVSRGMFVLENVREGNIVEEYEGEVCKGFI